MGVGGHWGLLRVHTIRVLSSFVAPYNGLIRCLGRAPPRWMHGSWSQRFDKRRKEEHLLSRWKRICTNKLQSLNWPSNSRGFTKMNPRVVGFCLHLLTLCTSFNLEAAKFNADIMMIQHKSQHHSLIEQTTVATDLDLCDP